MAKTTAQRQAEYRARRRQQGDTARLNTEVSLIAHFALERLAHHHGLTQRQMLERLLIESSRPCASALRATISAAISTGGRSE